MVDKHGTLNFEDLLIQLMLAEKCRKDLMPVFPFVPAPLGTFTYGQQSFESPVAHIRAMIRSMTPEERLLKVPLTERRMQRIARGSGTKVENVIALEKQLDLIRQSIARKGR